MEAEGSRQLRVVGWNANGGLAGRKGKAERLLALGPDVAVVSECANDIERIGPLARVGWTGTLPRKGLAVFAHPELRARVDPSHDPMRQFLLPVRLDGVAFSLLAVWAMNHRGDEPRPKDGRTQAALAHYATFLADADLVIGDFNDNIRWDTRKRPGFADTTRTLADADFANLYYERTDESPGAESVGTLYFHRHPDEPYLIDHAFLRRDRLADVREFAVCPPEEWLDVSDHVPLVLDVALPGLARPRTASAWDDIGPRVPIPPQPWLHSGRLIDAARAAMLMHAAQARKATDIPYVAHLFGTCAIVLEYGGSEDEAIAALLHDSLEDVHDPRARDAVAAFGPEVLAIVEGCSDTQTYPKPPWRERKEAYLRHIRSETNPSVLRVSAADKLHNARAMVADLRTMGEALWSKFNAPKADSLWYQRALFEAYRKNAVSIDDGLRELLDELERTIGELERLTTSAAGA